ncbi:alpha/beta fold hydrolase [Larkinella sp. VNQ87]|uniref:alpha/beta fold hydrolase n=1 Tax=Larkinella sp. VNQ87 TaxID=3400921 RepID=UPI003C125084
MEAGTMEAGWKSTRLSVNGLSLHVVEAGPEDGPLLILLHGFPEFWWAWRHQITPLADCGYRVIVPDMRGYNRSDAPQEVTAYRLDTLVADVMALADLYGADRFHLVGHDWGGLIAWGVGTSHAERLERLVIMDAPHPDRWVEQALRHPTQALRSTYVALFQLPWLPETALGALDFAALRSTLERTARPHTFRAGEMKHYTEAWAHPGSLTAMLNYYRALRERKKPDQPARIQTPTLVLWGEKDSFLELHLAHAALELCDNGQLSIIEGATHWLHLEEPARVNAELMRFLDSEG